MTRLFKDQIVIVEGEAPIEILIEEDEGAYDSLGTHDYRAAREGAVEEVFAKGMKLIRACAEEVASTVSEVSDKARPEGV